MKDLIDDMLSENKRAPVRVKIPEELKVKPDIVLLHCLENIKTYYDNKVEAPMFVFRGKSFPIDKGMYSSFMAISLYEPRDNIERVVRDLMIEFLMRKIMSMDAELPKPKGEVGRVFKQFVEFLIPLGLEGL